MLALIAVSLAGCGISYLDRPRYITPPSSTYIYDIPIHEKSLDVIVDVAMAEGWKVVDIDSSLHQVFVSKEMTLWQGSIQAAIQLHQTEPRRTRLKLLVGTEDFVMTPERDKRIVRLLGRLDEAFLQLEKQKISREDVVRGDES